MQEFTSSQSQALALAALLQSAQAVNQIAVNGKLGDEEFAPLLKSLFAFDSKHPADIYGGISGVEPGIKLLIAALSGNGAKQYSAALRYALAIIHLQGKLSQNPQQLQIIANRLQHIHFSAEHFINDISKISFNVAAVYKDTISTFKTRIHVNGNAIHLQNTNNADKIRTLLLAGIRASVLWRQMGGKRWQLFLARKRLLAAAQSLLNT